MAKIELSSKYSSAQLIILVGLRIVIGYHFLFEGVNKLFTDGWTSYGFLLESQWILADFFKYIANSPLLLAVVDQFNIWVQILLEDHLFWVQEQG
jgi:thiosulfate dehydrogenase [quinone] large subunit